MIQVGNIVEDSVKSFDKEGGESSRYQHSFPQRYREAYVKEMEAFVAIVRDPTLPNPVTREAVLLSSRIAEACERSFKEGKMVSLEE
jgi:myo-inositol 2-dehydrogenase/D-chiro-inositol 1-dehydrogenase